MAVKAIEMDCKIRDKHYEEIKNLSVEGQIKFIKQKSKELEKRLKTSQRYTADKTAKRLMLE
ncbi:MAG: hypothetical protein ACK41Q_08155 [Candidatus Brocadia sp.]